MNDPGRHDEKPGSGGSRQRRLGNSAIGERLRQMYDGVVQESVPDEFLKLLEQAEAVAKAKAESGDQGNGDA